MAVCFSSAKLCLLRVARLDSNCGCVTGSTAGAVTSGIVRLDANPDMETGQEYLLKNGCGDICVNFRDCDRLKRINLQMELCTRDMELLEILTGGTIYTSDGTTTGFSRRGIGSSCPNPVQLEIWTRAVDNTGTCTESGNPYAWWHIVYPKATFTLGDSTFENGVATVKLTGYSEANSQIGTGCWDDLPAGLDETSPEFFFLEDSSYVLPSATCGYVTVPVPA
jgi:hypothetical protein